MAKARNNGSKGNGSDQLPATSTNAVGPPARLTPIQARFAEKYAVTLSVTESCDYAGCQYKYGYEMLRHPHVVNRVQELQIESNRLIQVHAAVTLREMAHIAFSDVTEVYGYLSKENPGELNSDAPERIRKCIRKLKVEELHDADGNVKARKIEIETHPKGQALELMAGISGLKRLGEEGKPPPAPFQGVEMVVLESTEPEIE